MTDFEFFQLEDLETMPACPEGMALLRKFAMECPTLYDLADRVNLLDPMHPAFARNPQWLAFAQHRSTCDNCNEA